MAAALALAVARCNRNVKAALVLGSDRFVTAAAAVDSGVAVALVVVVFLTWTVFSFILASCFWDDGDDDEEEEDAVSFRFVVAFNRCSMRAFFSPSSLFRSSRDEVAHKDDVDWLFRRTRMPLGQFRLPLP